MSEYLSIKEMIGSVAALLSVVYLIPQLFKIWKTKSTKDLSSVMYLVYCSSSMLWIIYGILSSCYQLVICNFLTLVLAIFILIMKFSWDDKQRK